MRMLYKDYLWPQRLVREEYRRLLSRSQVHQRELYLLNTGLSYTVHELIKARFMIDFHHVYNVGGVATSLLQRGSRTHQRSGFLAPVGVFSGDAHVSEQDQEGCTQMDMAADSELHLFAGFNWCECWFSGGYNHQSQACCTFQVGLLGF